MTAGNMVIGTTQPGGNIKFVVKSLVLPLLLTIPPITCNCVVLNMRILCSPTLTLLLKPCFILDVNFKIHFL